MDNELKEVSVMMLNKALSDLDKRIDADDYIHNIDMCVGLINAISMCCMVIELKLGEDEEICLLLVQVSDKLNVLSTFIQISE